jgi:hypothetical protein
LSVKQAPHAENGFSMLRAAGRKARASDGKKTSATKMRAKGTKKIRA